MHIAGGVGVTFQLYSPGGNIVLNYDNVSKSGIGGLQVPVNGGGKVVFVKTATGNITVSN